MYLSYKLDNGKHVNVFDYGILEDESKGSEKYWRGYSDGYICDVNNRRGNEFQIDILKDPDRGFYFICEGERIYVSDYEFLTIRELNEKLENKEYVSEDLLKASLIKNANNIAFLESRRIPNFVWSEFFIRSYSGPARYRKVICVPTERYYKRENWQFKIETKPINDEDFKVFGHEKYYSCDYCERILRGEVNVLELDKVLALKDENGNVTFEKPEETVIVRSRKKEN